MRKITLLEVSAIDFKNHVEFNQLFGAMNTIKGMNGTGKSSIGEIITWTLGGCDMLGSKLDPTPTDRKSDKTVTSAVFTIDDEKVIKFTRELVKGKAAYRVNDIPKPATEFNELVRSLTNSNSIDLFLSLFNPSYFPTMHWNDQRNMLFNFVPDPASADILKKLPKLQADKLKAAFKKDKIADLEAFHKKNKTDKERESIAAKSRVDTLEGQMQGVAVENLTELQAEVEAIQNELQQAEEHQRNSYRLHELRNSKNIEINTLYQTIEKIKEEHGKCKAVDNCPSCGQGIEEDKKKETLSKINDRYKENLKRYRELQSEFDQMETPKVLDVNPNDLMMKRSQLNMKITAEQNRLKAIETIEAAKKAHEAVQASLTESIFLLDAIKAYRAEEATQKAEKVKALFTGIQIVLEDHLGKPAFTIAMDGKPYVKLSVGEKARAGLELIAVLTQQSGILAPTFIDNAESITSSFPVEHQAIAAYAKPIEYDSEWNVIYDGQLKIETDLEENKIIVDCEVV